MNSLTDLTATELHERLRCGETTPVAVTEACLGQIARLDDTLQAWETIDRHVIQAQLDKLAEQEDKTLPLYGIPIGVKDIYNTVDMATQMGSPLWKDFTPGNDARVVHNLRLEGGIMLGKTTTAEFAVHYQDKTRNPHDPSRSPGTSSAGSAVAVATGMVPVALGSQTAGSICRPASYCGVYGMKPTFGVMPRTGVLKTTDSLDSLGFFSRSVEDLKLMFDACRVKGQGYEFVHRYIDSYTPSPQKKYRVGFIKHPKWDLACDYAVEAIESFAQTLSSLPNVEIIEAFMPGEGYAIHEIHERIYDKALSYYFAKEAENHTLISPIFYDIVARGKGISTEQYQKDLQQQAHLTQWFDHYYSQFDILLTLTTAGDAPIGLTTPDIPDSNLIWTFLGMPTVSAPVFTSPNNLPFGALFVARKYQDPLLLDFLDTLTNHHILSPVRYHF